MVIYRKRTPSKLDLYCEDCILTAANELEILGVTIDSMLTWSNHHYNIAIGAGHKLGVLEKLANKLNTEFELLQISSQKCNGVCLPELDECFINKVRLTWKHPKAGTKNYRYITSLLQGAKWLQLQFCIKCKQTSAQSICRPYLHHLMRDVEQLALVYLCQTTLCPCQTDELAAWTEVSPTLQFPCRAVFEIMLLVTSPMLWLSPSNAVFGHFLAIS